MSDSPKRPVETIPSEEHGVSAVASAGAPFIYFDEAANWGLWPNGVPHITLQTYRHISTANGGVVSDKVMVGHLRMSVQALASLKAAIEGIEKMIRDNPRPVVN